jgi:transposase
MTAHFDSITSKPILIAVDIAKDKNVCVAEMPNGTKKKFDFDNTLEGFRFFEKTLLKNQKNVQIAIEATGDFHRTFAYFAINHGAEVKLVNTLVMSRVREVIHNSWDKNDPKDASVILHMLKNGMTQLYHDPKINNINSFREMAGLHFRLTRTKTKIQHNILNHYFTLYFPEGKAFFKTSRTRWVSRFLKHYPVPASVTKMSVDEFVKEAWKYLDHVPYREKILRSFYQACETTIGIPVTEDSWEAISLQQALNDHADLNQRIAQIEEQISTEFKDDSQYKILTSIPGIGPVTALNIIAESGDISRFGHSKQYLKYMGLNLCSSQSGTYQGAKSFSKRGNSRLRSVLWMATKSSIYSPSLNNPFKEKFHRMIKNNKGDGDQKRKAMSACTVKMAVVIHTLMKNKTYYRFSHETYNQAGKPLQLYVKA